MDTPLYKLPSSEWKFYRVFAALLEVKIVRKLKKAWNKNIQAFYGDWFFVQKITAGWILSIRLE